MQTQPPVLEQVDRDLKAIDALGLTLTLAVNTHCHADHITGTGAMKRRLAGLSSLISKASGAKADRHLKPGEAVRWAGEGPDRVPADRQQVIKYKT